ncbi:MAG: glutathione S-transferase family protein [Hyphomicrobiaceae bacterium]|nr:glutathione S-transferase family protein [Hyphomicrobiaceae bacterium]
MALTLYFHPLASFCQKVLIALYENGTPFDGHIVDLMDVGARSRFLGIWPVGKIPLLRDEASGQTVPETTIIIEYLERHFPGPRPLLPANEAERLDARLWDRVFDLYIQMPLQKIVIDRLRADGEHDARGVEDARATLGTAYDMIERQMAGKSWVIGEDFTMADCAAAPALFYSGIVAPFGEGRPNLAAYFERLLDRPSFKRAIDEAKPYFHMFPFKENMPARFLE